ncbi:MAG: hypothetical protein J6O49_09155 [Bacteroidaceae bacterium]|nr:hypothetical protein [Bacteroidaceae bacterium]
MRNLVISFLMIIGPFCLNEARAQSSTTANDSTVNAIKIRNLKAQKESLQKQIAIEDKKRNTVIAGVAVETMERMNEQQDSVCLELRSNLTSVELELKELGADNTTSQIAQQYNALRHNQQQDSIQVTTPNRPVPVRPGKPSKPSKKK